MAEINYNNGDKYVGEEVNGIRNGFGKYTFTDGSFYEGEYVKDKMEGWGTFSWANNGDLYVGEWEDDAENGQGTFTHGPKSDFAGDKYEGSFKNGVKSGYGTYFFADGEKYEGYWQNDQQNGAGTFTHNNGEVTSGEWKNGELILVNDSSNNINTEPKERVNNNNREKTITVQQIIYNSTKGGQLNYGMKYFHAASFEDLKIQLIDHYVHLLETGSLASKSMESGQNNIAVDRESGQDVEANLKAYKKIFDVETRTDL